MQLDDFLGILITVEYNVVDFQVHPGSCQGLASLFIYGVKALVGGTALPTFGFMSAHRSLSIRQMITAK